MERRGRKGSSCARSEEMERAGDRWEKMAGYFSTGQSPQRAVVLMEEEKERLLSQSTDPMYPSAKFNFLLRQCQRLSSARMTDCDER